MEQIFTFIDEHAKKIQTTEDLTYIEGVLETTEMWLDGDIEPKIENVQKEDIRKAIQLSILKGMKQHVQAHHQMTPDSLGLLVGYFVDALTKDKQHLTLLDPAVGTGNLLFTVLNFLQGLISDEQLVKVVSGSYKLNIPAILTFTIMSIAYLLIPKEFSPGMLIFISSSIVYLLLKKNFSHKLDDN